MNEHDAIREWLALAAAGALDPAEQRRLERHAAGCPACAAELEQLRDLAGALRRLPTPQPPATVVERARARALAAQAAAAERRWDRAVLAFLALVSWTVTLATWPIVRLVTGGVLGWLDLRLNQLWIALLGYTALAWLTAGVAAVVLGLRFRATRRIV
jgi:anti-sigma factor RsiW